VTKAKKKIKYLDSRTIRISGAVWDAIAKEASHYRETPDVILRRKYKIDQKEHWTKRD